LNKITKIRDHGDRIDTGALQFGNDWPGLFIRGDHALHFAYKLNKILTIIKENKEVMKKLSFETIDGLDLMQEYIDIIRNDVQV